MVPRLDVRRLNAEKKYSGELSFSFDPEEDPVEIPYVSLVSPIRAELGYEILEDDSVEIRGTIGFTLKGLCSRCLKEMEKRFSEEVEGYFVPDGDGREDYAYTNGVIDLREFLRDAVLFSMPAGLYCSETCTAPEYKED